MSNGNYSQCTGYNQGSIAIIAIATSGCALAAYMVHPKRIVFVVHNTVATYLRWCDVNIINTEILIISNSKTLKIYRYTTVHPRHVLVCKTDLAVLRQTQYRVISSIIV